MQRINPPPNPSGLPPAPAQTRRGGPATVTSELLHCVSFMVGAGRPDCIGGASMLVLNLLSVGTRHRSCTEHPTPSNSIQLRQSSLDLDPALGRAGTLSPLSRRAGGAAAQAGPTVSKTNLTCESLSRRHWALKPVGGGCPHSGASPGGRAGAAFPV